MKRVLFAALTAAIILLSACSAGGGVAGRWRTRFYSEEAEGTVELIYDFRDNGILYVCTDGENGFALPFGTYETSGEELVIRAGSGAERYAFSVTDDRLVLRQNGRETSFERIEE